MKAAIAIDDWKLPIFERLIERLQGYAETWYDGGAFATTSRAPKLAADISAAADALTALLDENERLREMETYRNDQALRLTYRAEVAESALTTVRQENEQLQYELDHYDDPEICQVEGCGKKAGCGTPTLNDGYKRCCYAHFETFQKELHRAEQPKE